MQEVVAGSRRVGRDRTRIYTGQLHIKSYYSDKKSYLNSAVPTCIRYLAFQRKESLANVRHSGKRTPLVDGGFNR